MNRQMVAETSLAGLRPLGIGGRRVQDSWHEIDSYLRGSLGERYADLFAEPVPGSAGLSWFAAPEGEVKAYSALDAEEQRRLLAEVEHRLAEIRQHIAGLAESKRDSDRRLAETLERAVVVPEQKADRDFLYSVAGEPVLVNWGTRDEGADSGQAVLQDFLRGEALRLRQKKEAARVPAATAGGQPVTVVREVVEVFPWWWLLWLLFGLLMAVLFYFLLIGCGLRGPFGLERPAFLNFCPGALAAVDPNTDALADERERGQGLQRELLELERRLARVPRCPPQTAQLQEEPPPPEEPEQDNVLDDVRERGGEAGEMEIVLRWQGDADLDLRVVCPDGSEINYQNKTSASCRGSLDIDDNDRVENIRSDPTEHVTWPGGAPPGPYRVIVDNYAGRSAGPVTPVPYTVYIIRDGETESYEGRIGEAGPGEMVQEFSVP